MFMEAIWEEKYFELDLKQVPLPFNNNRYEGILKKKLRIGFFDQLPTIPCSNSVKRAVNIAKQALEKQGHTLIPF